VWCAILKFGVIGPYFFEENGQNVTVNSQRYVFMLEKFFEPQLKELMGETDRIGDIWFQQDGGYSTYCSRFNDEAATDVPYAPRQSER